MATLNCLCDWQRFYAEENPAEPLMEKIESRHPGCPVHQKATVVIFKPSGKYYTTERWTIPENAIGPYDMDRAPEARRWLDKGAGWMALVETQEPWGFPHLLLRTA